MFRKMVATMVLSSLVLAAHASAGTHIPGGQSTVERVQAFGIDTYTSYFVAGEVAAVRVVGDHDTDLDLYVYDENNNLIASDTDNTDSCLVTLTPRWTGKFKIVVKNRGSVYNQYVVSTN